jgi:hypothetical protein
VWVIITMFRFKFLVGEKVVDVFENEFVTMVRVVCGCSEVAELDVVECGVIPVVNVPTFLEEIGSQCSATNTMLVMSSNGSIPNAEMGFGCGE